MKYFLLNPPIKFGRSLFGLFQKISSQKITNNFILITLK